MTLRADAPAFLMPPPGLGTLCGGEADAAWHSPCSTALPSPSLGATSPPFGGSPSLWADVFEPSRCHLGSEDLGQLTLPDAFPDIAMEEDIYIPYESAALEFKLTGMEDLQNSVASLLASFVGTPSVDGGSSTSVGASDEEESLCPSTPQPVEEVSPILAPPGLELDVESTPEPEQAPAAEASGQTSAALQNVPRKCTRDLLAKILDEAGFRGDYDLIYVTADIKQRNSGSGSALVNFRTEEACSRFTSAFHKAGVASVFPGFAGKKPIEVAAAPIQGLEANVRKLEKSGVLMSMLCERPGWQPARYNRAGEIEAEIGS